MHAEFPIRNMPSLTKISLPDAHLVNGNEFPVAYSLDADQAFLNSHDKVTGLLEQLAKEQFFNNALAQHGAIVIRNTGTTDPKVLSKYINAIGSGGGDVFFVQNGTTAKRTEITEILSTANEGPSSTYIHQHNEYSRFTKYPDKLFFICTKYGPGTKGGETPIMHGGEYFNLLQEHVPELVDQLAKRGLYYLQTWTKTSTTKTSWRDYFCFGRNISDKDSLEEAKKKAELAVKKYVSTDFSWSEDDNLVVHQHTKPIRLHKDPVTKKEHPTIFSSVATYYFQSKQANANTPTKPLMYDDDGEVISYDLLEKALQLSMDFSYEHKWQEGDIAIVDNRQVSHGRCPWSDGPREILVSMWDAPSEQKQQYPVYST